MTTRLEATVKGGLALDQQHVIDHGQDRAALTRALYETRNVPCACGLHARMSDERLRALGAGCTAPRYVCPRLDSVRRRLGL